MRRSRRDLVTGDAVNIAARLEQAAAPGEVLLGEATYRLVRDAVTGGAGRADRAKGKSEPLGRLPAARGTRAGPLPRRRDAVHRPWRRARLASSASSKRRCAERRCRMVTVLGEPGVGKSRLTAEFVAHMDGRARVVRGRCLSYGEGITYWAIAEIMRELVGIGEDHSVAEARALIDAHTERMPSGPAVAAKLARMLGLADGAATSPRTRLGGPARPGRGARPSCRSSWSSTTSTGRSRRCTTCSTGLPAAIDDAPILVLCLGRLELLEHRPDWPVGLRLEALGAQDVDALARRACWAARPRAYASASAGLGRQPAVRRGARGDAARQGRPASRGRRCTIAGDLDALHLPPSVNALLGARLDRLDPERGTRSSAARSTARSSIAAPSSSCRSPSRRPSVPAVLEALAAKELVRPAEPSFAGEVAFRFKHILVRETAYRATAKGFAPRCTSGSRNGSSTFAGERVVEVEEIVGYHLEQSYRYRTEIGGTTTRFGRSASREPVTCSPRRSGRRPEATTPPPRASSSARSASAWRIRAAGSAPSWT